MANEERTLTGAIRDVVRAELRFLRHYWGEVINVGDELDRGRVQVSIPMLGWDTPVSAPWCEPRTLHSIQPPSVGEFVEVYFVEGNRSRPVYIGSAWEFKAMAPPSAYSGPTTRVIYGATGEPVAVVHNTRTDELILQTGDAAGWKPNTLVTDPYTGLPHSGIVRLKGA